MCSVMSTSMTPWTVVHQAHLSMKFSRQEYSSGLPFPTPGGFSHSRGIFPIQKSNSCLLHLLNWQVDSLPLWDLGSLVQWLLGGKMVRMSRLTRADSEKKQRPWWWFESLTQGISSRFPLADHLALPVSESIWFISGSSPTCVRLLVKMESGKEAYG